MGLNKPTEILDSFRWGIRRIWKKPRSPHPQVCWKTKCGRNKCCAIREPP